MLRLAYCCFVLMSPDPIETGPEIRPDMAILAQGLQLMDANESRYMLAQDSDWVADLRNVRDRWVELRHAPLLQDAYRFPDRDTTLALTAFQARWFEHITARHALTRDTRDRKALEETVHLMKVWAEISTVTCGYYQVQVRRRAMMWLLNEIGPDAYYMGSWPPHVPVWRFHE